MLAKSSNIGAIQIGLKVGNKRLWEYVKSFGFGARTGIPMPGESPGMVRNWQKWHPAAIGSIAMGHEIITTYGAARASRVRRRQRRNARETAPDSEAAGRSADEQIELEPPNG